MITTMMMMIYVLCTLLPLEKFNKNIYIRRCWQYRWDSSCCSRIERLRQTDRKKERERERAKKNTRERENKRARVKNEKNLTFV